MSSLCNCVCPGRVRHTLFPSLLFFFTINWKFYCWSRRRQTEIERQINKEQKKTGCAETESEWQPKKRKWTENDTNRKSHTQTHETKSWTQDPQEWRATQMMAKVKIKPSWRWKTVSQRQLPNHFLSISIRRLTMFVKLETAPSVRKWPLDTLATRRLLDIWWMREKELNQWKQWRGRVKVDVRNG